MRIPRLFTFFTLLGALHWGDALAQSTTNEPLFRVNFSATCQGFDATKNRVVTTRITDRTIIAQATGVSASSRTSTRDFALVYNPSEDSLQVANANGEPVVDVVHFGGGAATGDTRQAVRLTFMFFPGQTNEFGAETNVFGTALITERASGGSSSGAKARANISGKLQFTLASGTPLGTTNLESGTNVQICTGLFATGGAFPTGAASGGVAGGTTGTTGTTTTGGTSTNGIAGTNGTGGAVVTGTTGTTTGTGTGINTVTPVVIVTAPNTVIPTATGTLTTTSGSAVGTLPGLTANGSLSGLGTTVGAGTVSVAPFNTTTPVTVGTPVTTVNGGTPVLGTTTTITPVGTIGTTTTVGTTTGLGATTGTATGTLTPSGSLTGF